MDDNQIGYGLGVHTKFCKQYFNYNIYIGKRKE